MDARLGGVRVEHVLAFGQTRQFHYHGVSYSITLLPAGHIFGSAMSLVETAEESLLYTGDFKLRRGLSSEPCEPRHAETLIMETTFGRSQYVFPPTEGVLKGIVRFCREALDNEETPVLLGYSLGKSQEVLCSLAEAKLPIMLHGAVWKLTRVYEQFGHCFPAYEPYDSKSARGKVLLCPPNVVNSAMLRNLGKVRTAILSGWAVDPNARYRYQCDAAFPLSDHADFNDLIELVKRVAPRRVYTLHGFAAEFAQTLRDLGYESQALSQDEQLAFPMLQNSTLPNPKSRVAGLESPARNPVTKPMPTLNTETLSSPSSFHDQPTSPDAFARFAFTCSAIAVQSGKLEKVRILAEYLRSLKGPSVSLAATWFTGRPFGSRQNKVLQLGWAVLRDALCKAAKVDENTLRQVYLQYSDLGETAAHVLDGKPQNPRLLLTDIEELFEKLHAARGPLRKTPLLERAFEQTSALEAKYLVKIITGDLRIGLKEGLVEESIASAFDKAQSDIRQASLLLGDIGETAQLACENRLSDATLTAFRPAKFMLASPEATADAVWERVQEWTQGEQPNLASSERARTTATVWLEDKYDGIRCQLHKVGQRTALYSRDLKEITTTFLELADEAGKLPQDFVLDGEIVAMRGAEILPFAELQKRLGRREADLFMREEVPIKFVAFDLLWLGGTSLLGRSLRLRRETLESVIAPGASHLILAHITQANSAPQIDAAFDAARRRGNEGLMIKDPFSTYTPGRRGLSWLKLKKAFATLDCVVVGAEYGHGKRSKVLSDYTFAVYDETSGELKTIGKAYTGLTDAEIEQLTQHFFATAVRQHGRFFEVRPDTILEIAFDKIQPSARHNSGLALRFPRIVRIRTDKSVAEIDTLANARKLVSSNK
jgi:DNA ligase-1